MKEKIKNKKLILLKGLPRSGKSTLAKHLMKEKNYVIVNPDSIRLALHGQRFNENLEPLVWMTAYAMTEALFLAGHETVVIDATNTTEKRRKPWYDRFKNIAEIEEILVDTPAKICKARALSDHDEEMIPVIERMARDTDIDSLKEDDEDRLFFNNIRNVIKTFRRIKS